MLSITRFFTGQVSQRSPLNTPFSFAGLNMVQRNDALITGVNAEVSNNYTLQRRPGFPRYCNQGFAGTEFPLFFSSFRINGQVIDIVDTNLAVYTFTPTSKTLLWTKSAGAGQTFFQQIGNVLYFSNGVDNKKWIPSPLSWAANTTFNVGQFITDTNGNTQQVTTGGTSGGSQPVWSQTPRGTTNDGVGTLVWTMRGNQVSNWGIAAPAAAPTVAPPTTPNVFAVRYWVPNTNYGGPPNNEYSIIDKQGFIQLMTTVGTTGANYPLFNENFGSTTTDNSATWTNCGQPTPIVGAYKGNAQVFVQFSSLIDTNGNIQVATTGGTTGGGTTFPNFSSTVGGTVADNTITWTCVGVGTQSAFSGYQWVSAFHTVYGHVSTASPMSINTGPVFGQSFSSNLSGNGSADPQCDFVWVFRIADGGSTFQFAFAVANPGAGTWGPTSDATLDVNLNPQLPAALNHANDPPPAGMAAITYYMRRMWGAVGNTMQYGIGPDGLIGVKEESWPPANFETFATTVQNMAGTSQGLCVFTNDQWWVEMGGPQTLSFYPLHVLDNFGISSPNCLAADGDQLYVYSSSKQLWSVSLGTGKDEAGFAVGDIMSGTNAAFPGVVFNPATSYLTVHQNGTDAGLFLSDGVGNVLRLSLKLDAWGTLYQIQGGVGAIQSIETAFGTYGLMAGRPAGGGFVMARDQNNFYDDVIANTYVWNAQIGSVHVSQPGTPQEDIQSIVLTTTNAGAVLKVGVLINEISGTPVNVPFVPRPSDGLPVSDPYDVPPQTLRSLRYDLALASQVVNGAQQPLPNQIRHMQINISGIAENAKSEVLGVHLCPQVE